MINITHFIFYFLILSNKSDEKKRGIKSKKSSELKAIKKFYEINALQTQKVRAFMEEWSLSIASKNIFSSRYLANTMNSLKLIDIKLGP
ncbi:MAG: hypothetical protein B6I30_04575 [Desulfobacteraceae bacterium 4572_187]|nr:MAG: hypothetical protein B6I30_04575 [Desulfobacteraceae bacterium 4572_187]RLB82281.1 MAG: hypothetical protein DRH24_08105 [Deltaproteobacteria bacterium]